MAHVVQTFLFVSNTFLELLWNTFLGASAMGGGGRAPSNSHKDDRMRAVESPRDGLQAEMHNVTKMRNLETRQC